MGWRTDCWRRLCSDHSKRHCTAAFIHNKSNYRKREFDAGNRGESWSVDALQFVTGDSGVGGGGGSDYDWYCDDGIGEKKQKLLAFFMKNRILAIAFVLFFAIWLYSWFRPKTGMCKELTMPEMIDSVEIKCYDCVDAYDGEYYLVSIVDAPTIKLLTEKLSQSKIFEPRFVKGDSSSTDLLFFVKNRSKPCFLRIEYERMDTCKIDAGDYYYKNDGLDSLVKLLIKSK